MSSYGLYNENGVLQQVVHVHEGDLESVEIPLGWTLRDDKNTVVEFEDPAKLLLARIRASLDDLAAQIDELEELIHG